MTLYNWTNAPAKATHAATDASGDAFWYAPEPQINEASKMWVLPALPRDPLVATVDKSDILRRVRNWRHSLEARP
jgi:hypothetical protein